MKTTSLGLKKPEGTDPVDIQDFNDNADTIDAALNKRPEKTGDASNMTVAFTESASLAELTSNDSMKGLFGKLKLVTKNVISLARLMGTADISKIGNGTVTGAISQLNGNLDHLGGAVNIHTSASGGADKLSEQLYNIWSDIPGAYGCLRIGNGSTVYSGTYIKYNNANGSITLTSAAGEVIVWRILNEEYNLTNISNGISTFRQKLSYITNYYCMADIVVPSGYIAFATIYTAENVPIDHITQIRCERFADTVIRVVAVSNGEFIPSSAVYVNVLITPDN